MIQCKVNPMTVEQMKKILADTIEMPQHFKTKAA